jgi:hypothetical protein
MCNQDVKNSTPVGFCFLFFFDVFKQETLALLVGSHVLLAV